MYYCSVTEWAEVDTFISTNANLQFLGFFDQASPTKTAVVKAMHLYPEAPKVAPVKAFKASSLSASGRMIPWFLAPILD